MSLMVLLISSSYRNDHKLTFIFISGFHRLLWPQKTVRSELIFEKVTTRGLCFLYKFGFGNCLIQKKKTKQICIYGEMY